MALSINPGKETPMLPSNGPASHCTYLLTVWREGGGAVWRAALRPAGGGERMGFADLEQLAAFLLHQGRLAIWERTTTRPDERSRRHGNHLEARNH
jgi:hypothetical protein